ncbi:MAG: dipeptide/oligopeptide/nickel transporter ATP-binding protein [Verrucomicrobiales bacterium]|nr:dipeptide/oligopeptide/nickel transporter ATP-binding protein [Verrucomicrobiales bacterium]
MATPLLQVDDLAVSFHTRNGIVRAVRNISFQVNRGETLGIVGESGSGKSVCCYSLLRLLPMPPGRIESGKAIFDGSMDLLSASIRDLNKVRGKRISMIFQDPMTSLNPYLKVGQQIMEPLLIHGSTTKAAARAQAIEMLKSVGIHDGEQRMEAYPHQFSGGMRQRVMIAMALITKPDLLIADEPTTALDVTVQAQILELIKKMQGELGTAVIFISHDMGVVAGFCDRVNVMYAGKIVESAGTQKIFEEPQHPYNKALQKSIPSLQQKGKELFTIEGLPPDLAGDLRGCPFAPRCAYAVDYCRRDPVELLETRPGHYSACLRVQRKEITLQS